MSARRKNELKYAANDALRAETLRRRLEILKHPPKRKPVAHPFQGVGLTVRREDALTDEALSEGE